MNMKTLTVEQVEEDFDAIMSRVEAGESFIIHSESGNVMLIPYEDAELMRIYTDHEEGC